MEKKRSKKRLNVSPQIRQLSFDLKSAIKKPDEQGAFVRLALFLGAGASFQSGIPVGGGMIRHFKSEIFRRHGKKYTSEKDGNIWIEGQGWYVKDESDYCQLFEYCYSTEAKRRSYIESIIERKQPSVGYIVLANLIKYGYLKTIVTTNFDSLISLACSNYTDIFPVVYSLGNFASEMTVSSERPRILKIHGDFLFSKLKNTTDDLEKPDENMERQMARILEEYDGIIVIGYAGNDNSVMGIFEKMPAGKTIYWCDLAEDNISERAKKFLEDKGGTFVKIEGFDELMQIIRILIELDNERITKTFQDRQIEINKKISEFEDVVLFDEETQDSLEEKETTGFSDVLDKSREVTQLLIAGNKAYYDGNFSLAEENYQKAIELNPNYASAYNNLSILLAEDKNRWKEAEENYRKAIELTPNDADVYINLGNLLAEDKNRRQEAEENYRKANELNPNDASAYNNLGNLLAEDENRLKEAEENYQKAIELNPSYADAYNNLGGLLAKEENRLKETEDNYRKAIELNPSYADAYNNLGNLLAKDENRQQEAEENYQKAIELNPNYASAYNNLGVLLAKDENRRQEAEENYQKAIELNPNYADAYYNLGVLLAEDENRRQEAEENYRKAIELNPNDASAYNNLGVLLAEDKNRWKETEENYRKAIELNPNYANAYNNLGVLLAKDENRRQEAEENYRKAIELNPSYANFYYNLGCLNSLRNRRDKALEYLRQAVEMDSKVKSMAKADSDFDSLHNDEEFLEIVGRDEEE